MILPRVSSSHLLAQRLDALLGTKLAQQLASSTRPTTQDFIPQAARVPPLETAAQAPDRPPSPLPEHSPQQARQPLSQQARQAPAALSPARGLLPGLQAADLPGTPSAPISLGNTAQLLVQLLRHFPSPLPAVGHAQPLLPSGPSGPSAPGQAASSPAAAAAPAPSPSSTAPGMLQFSSPAAATLFQSLEHAVRHSGLFYESHLAQFAAGRYPRAQLLMEPQARLADAAGAPDKPPAQAAPGTRADAEPQSQAASSSPTQSAAPARPAEALPAGTVLPPDAALTVRQQLETLALQTLQWRGEAWPQADMQWTVSRDEQHGEAQADAQAQQWSSQLTLTLPRLGEIHAQLHLSGQTLSIRLAAPQADDRLSAQAQTLRQQIQATGLVLRQLHISPAFEDTPAEAQADHGGAPPAGPQDE